MLQGCSRGIDPGAKTSTQIIMHNGSCLAPKVDGIIENQNIGRDGGKMWRIMRTYKPLMSAGRNFLEG